MRLTADEIRSISNIVQSYSGDHATLYLYGSRTDDTKKGGDIDLLLVVREKSAEDEVNRKIHLLLSEIKDSIGDQRIDFSVKAQDGIKEDPFFRSVLPAAVVIADW